MGNKRIPIGKYAFTASQVANLYSCGFGTMFDLYVAYKGLKAEYPKQENEQAKASMEFGTFFEDAVAKFAAHKLGDLKLQKCGTMAYFADDMPYFICHPDRLVIGLDKKGRRAAIEVKCVQPFAEGWGEEGTDRIPDNYFFQVQSYFACEVPCDVVYVACLRGNRVYIYEILPDWEIVNDIKKRVREAKESFDKNIVPAFENLKEETAYYSKRVNMMSDEGIGANDEVLAIYKELCEADSAIKEKTKTLEELKGKLIEKLGSYPSFVTIEGKKIKKLCYWLEKTSTKTDYKKFEADNPNLNFDKYRTTSKSREFRVNYPTKEKN